MAGAGESGQLGLRGRAEAPAPTRLPALESWKVMQAAAGPAHTLASLHNGSVAAWGAAEFGALGLGDAAGVQVRPPAPWAARPPGLPESPPARPRIVCWPHPG